MTEQSAPDFAADEIEDAARAFDHAATELLRAECATWAARLGTVLHVGRANRVLRHILEPLRGLEFDPAAWWQGRTTGYAWAVNGGGGPLDLPPEPARAAGTVLRLLAFFAEEHLRPEQVVMGVVGVRSPGNFDVRIRKTSDVLLAPLRPYVAEELRTRARRQREVEQRDRRVVDACEPADVDEAGRTFAAAADGVRTATDHAWLGRVRTFLHVLRDDAVLAAVARPLRHGDMDAVGWWRARDGKFAAGTFDSEPPDFPSEPERRAALSIQLLDLFARERVDVDQVSAQTVGIPNDGRSEVEHLYADLVAPLVAWVEGRLRDLRRRAQARSAPTQTGPQTSAAGATYYQPTFHGPVGNVVVGDNNTATQSATVTYQPASDLAREIASWTELLGAVEVDRHAEVRAAIDGLARSADEGGAKLGTLVQQAETVVEAHPSLLARVGALLKRGAAAVSGPATALVTSAAGEAGKQLASHPDKVFQALQFAYDHALHIGS